MADISISGDFGKLKNWQKLFGEGDAVLKPMSSAMAERVIGLIQEGFVTETDPYGVPWAPKKNPDGRKVLSGETGRLKTGWHAAALDGGGFTVAPSVDYAAPHQAPKRGPGGRLKRPRRRMVPSGDRGLPQRWRKAMAETATAAMVVYFGGGGGGGLGPVASRIAALKRRFSAKGLLRSAISAARRSDDNDK